MKLTSLKVCVDARVLSLSGGVGHCRACGWWSVKSVWIVQVKRASLGDCIYEKLEHKAFARVGANFKSPAPPMMSILSGLF